MIGQFHETRLVGTGGSTEVLASLAWLGTPSTTWGSYAANRRRPSANPAFSPDHFSMAIAVEDDSMSDDALVNRLEEVRQIGGASTYGRCVSPSRSRRSPSSGPYGDNNGFAPISWLSPLPAPVQHAQSNEGLLPSSHTTSCSEDAEIWQAARKTLLCIREIVRTEKKYQEALTMLLNAQVCLLSPTPLSLHHAI